VGFGFGPLLPAWITDYVFADQALLGRSVAIVASIAGVISALLLWTGCAPLRTALVAARLWTTADRSEQGTITGRNDPGLLARAPHVRAGADA
jgi:hypothetical protein